MAKLLTEKAAQRTADVVRRVEGQPRDLTRDRVPAAGVPFEFCRFELAEALVPGGTAEAYRVSYDGSAYSAETTLATITVVDFLGTRRAETGRRGLASKAPDREEWEIWDLEHQARRIKFVVDNGAGYATTDLEWTVDGVQYIDGYEPATPITSVFNTDESGGNYKFEGDDNDEGDAYYDPENDKYWIIQMECP